MNIRLDDKYRIVSDRYNVILQEVKIRATGNNIGEEYHENYGYYGTVTACLKAYKELLIKESDVTTIQELVERIEEIDKKIGEILKGN